MCHRRKCATKCESIYIRQIYELNAPHFPFSKSSSIVSITMSKNENKRSPFAPVQLAQGIQMSINENEPSPFAIQLAQEIEKMISTKESRALLDEYAKIPFNPATEKQLALVTKGLEETIATDMQFCFINQPLLPPTLTMLESKGYTVGGFRGRNGFYIDIFPGASDETISIKQMDRFQTMLDKVLTPETPTPVKFSDQVE